MSAYTRLEGSFDTDTDNGKELEADAHENEDFLDSRSRLRKPLRSWLQTHLWSIIVHLMLLCLNLVIVSMYGEAWFSSKSPQNSTSSSKSIKEGEHY